MVHRAATAPSEGAPLRVLTLASLFPNAFQPRLGDIVFNQCLHLQALCPDIELQVVSPVRVLPFPFSLRGLHRWKLDLPSQERWKGLIVHRPRYTGIPRVQVHEPRLIAAALTPFLRRLRRSFPFEVLDAEWFWPDGPAAMLLARLLRVPFSIKARGPDLLSYARRPSLRPQILAAGKAADGLLAVSAAIRSEMVAMGMPADRIAVHYTGLDRALFRPRDRQAARDALGLRGPVLLIPGIIGKRKGQMTAVEALAMLPGATLIVAGRGASQPRLEERIQALGLQDRVRFVGMVDQAELAALYAAADVTLLPSTSEGLANVWVESLACGTPVVTSDVGGAREVIRSPAAGRIVPIDPAAVAGAVREILAAPPPPEAVAEAAARFSWEANALQMRDHLRALAAGRPSMARGPSGDRLTA